MSDNLLMLLEMIEEVLEERPKNPILKIANQYVKLVRAQGDAYKNAKLEAIPTPNSRVIRITNAGSRQQRDELTRALKLQPDLKGNYYEKDGKRVGGQIPKEPTLAIRFFQGATKGVVNLSQRFEDNLIKTLNGDAAQQTDHVSEKEFSGIQEIAEKVIINSKLTGASPWRKPGNGSVSLAYKLLDGTRARVNATPKTDIADTKIRRVSVKKDGAQLLSGQAREVQAITEVVAKAVGLDKELKKQLISEVVKMGSKKEIDALTPAHRRALGKEIAGRLFQDNNFKKQFLLEAMTGNKRFVPEGAEAIANSLLIWNLSGNGYFNDNMGQWVEQNYQKVKYDVRSRGEGRGLAVRLETIAKHLQKEYEKSLKLKEELATARKINKIFLPPSIEELPKEEEPAKIGIGSLSPEIEKLVDELYEETPEPKFLNTLDIFVEVDYEFTIATTEGT